MQTQLAQSSGGKRAGLTCDLGWRFVNAGLSSTTVGSQGWPSPALANLRAWLVTWPGFLVNAGLSAPTSASQGGPRPALANERAVLVTLAGPGHEPEPVTPNRT